jgi:hypothetical protein
MSIIDDLDLCLLDRCRVFTTIDGAKNLVPYPAVHVLEPWEKIDIMIAEKKFQIISTPTSHTHGQ